MSVNKKKILLVYATLVCVIVVLDQVSKYVATSYLLYGVPEIVWSWFNLTLIHNQGAAFSFLADMGGWQRWFLTGVSSVAVIGLAIWLAYTPKQDILLRLTIALILAGAIGNLYDRITLGYVIDFISVHYNNLYFFPTFNIADSAISCGVALLLLDVIIKSRHDKK